MCIAPNELGVDGVAVEDGREARHQQLLAGTRHSDIELAVDGASKKKKKKKNQEVEISLVLHTKGIDNDIAM